ncbi:hypothetical protein [Variovorax ginsengisoli]|uniref:Uncharacterized protein n=1 Tax=Variovorax ginsengisoli TaxID=363844 RepID=A0ABT9S9W2_9BURK|nr:hypothetical protein [Variovorax ginsengisoli]MDP9901146.1 hypothetical protein [Variovorax ginsengisoli]
MDPINLSTKSNNRAARRSRAATALGARLTGKLMATDAIGALLDAVRESGD